MRSRPDRPAGLCARTAAALLAAALSGCGTEPPRPGRSQPPHPERVAPARSAPGPGGPPLTHAPVDPARIARLIPLGRLAPPSHTFPTDHIYLHADPQRSPRGVVVRAPADLWITRVGRTRYAPGRRPGRRALRPDHTIEFEVTPAVRGRFGHVVTLDEDLARRIGSLAAGPDVEVARWQTADVRVVETSRRLRLRVAGGTPLGRAALPGSALDLWISDRRRARTIVHPSIREWLAHAANPLDYFVPTVRRALEARLAGPARHRGRLDGDTPGTAHGLWTLARIPDGLRVEDVGVALVGCDLDPSRQAISIGLHGFAGDATVYRYRPAASGTRNRDVTTIRPGETVYGYALRGPDDRPVRAQVLLRLQAPRRLQLQFVPRPEPPTAEPARLWNRAGNAIIELVR